MVKRRSNPASGRPRAPWSHAAQRGSVLLITLVFVIILSMMAASVFELSNASYKLTMRNQLQAEARAVAESELEYMLFEFKSCVVSGNSAYDAPGILATSASPAGVAISDNTSYPDRTTTRAPFLESHQAAGWRVRRSIIRDRFLQNQRVPGTTKIGDFTYVIARVEVLPPANNPFAASTASVRVGRRLINSNTTIFQYSVFFQGNLELNPGNDTRIDGDVVANGSIYMGPRAGYELLLTGKVRYLADHYFNTNSAGVTTYSNPDAPTPPVTLAAPTFSVSQADQLETLDSPENLLGGIDVTVEAQTRPDLFGPSGRTDPSDWTPAEQAQAENNVYRSLIVPPPDEAGASEYPNATGATADDAVIAVRRAYNRAELIVTVQADGSLSINKVKDGVSTDVTSIFITGRDSGGTLITATDTDGTTYTAGGAIQDFADYVSDPSADPDYTTSVYDEREAKVVKVTEVKVDKLKETLDALHTLPPSDPNYFEFNGLLYVNLTSSSSSTPAAVRLIDATAVPTNGDVGFSLATNGGIYVKGSFNNSPGQITTNADGTLRHPASMLIGDAITILSDAWTDSTTHRDISLRVAGNSAEINAGLLTGNISSTGSASSGGVQNVVRYMENWNTKSVTFLGSLGRLFASTQFTAGFSGPGQVYIQPSSRTFQFDSNFLIHRPPGSPESTAFSRGSFFTWNYDS